MCITSIFFIGITINFIQTLFRVFRPIFATHFDSIEPDLVVGLIHVYIIFYSFKHDPSPCYILEKLRKYGFEGISWFLLDLLHEPSMRATK